MILDLTLLTEDVNNGAFAISVIAAKVAWGVNKVSAKPNIEFNDEFLVTLHDESKFDMLKLMVQKCTMVSV